jgi:hypothetical protein
MKNVETTCPTELRTSMAMSSRANVPVSVSRTEPQIV